MTRKTSEAKRELQWLVNHGFSKESFFEYADLYGELADHFETKGEAQKIARQVAQFERLRQTFTTGDTLPAGKRDDNLGRA